jgi:hypothetical protein
LAIVSLLSLSIPLPAQTPRPGSLVRVTSSVGPDPLVGVLVAVTNDSISIRRELDPRATTLRFDTLSLQRDAVKLLEVKTGEHRNALNGLLIGTVIGAVTAAAIAAATDSGCDIRTVDRNYSSCTDLPKGQVALLGAAGGGIVGMLLGTVAGALTVTDEWSPSAGIRGSINRRSLAVIAFRY